jgi:hypothetical protein
MILRKAGIWIDYQHAIVVLTSDEREDINKFNSGIEVTHGQQELDSHTLRTRAGSKRLGRRFMNQLHRFFDAIVASLPECPALMIMGPGDSKLEFVRYLESTKLQGLSVELEAAAVAPLPKSRHDRVRECGDITHRGSCPPNCRPSLA